MKNTFVLFLLFLPPVLFSQAPLPALFSAQLPVREQKIHEKSLREFTPAIGTDYDIVFHRCEWEIDPNISYIKGNITTYLKPVLTGLNRIEFNLSGNYTIDSVIFQGDTVPFNQNIKEVLQINLPISIPINTLDSVSVFYQGIPPNADTASFFRDTHNDSAIVWTLSEPFGSKDWWPCKPSLTDKIDSLDILVTTPMPNKVASIGTLVSETTKGASTTFHWKSRYPIATYLIGIAISNYAVYSDFVPLKNGDTLEVLNYVYPETLAETMEQSAAIGNIIQLMDSLTIPYPFSKEKYGHAQFGWGGGIEHQTMSFVVNFSSELLAHECAHQWFGDHVTCGSWQDIWLNEGFATYFEGLVTENLHPENWMAWKQKALEKITALPDGSVLCEDTTSSLRIFDARLSYYKAAYVLHMLRWKLGDSLFFLSIQNYLKDPLLQGNFANTEALIAHFENTGNADLTVFFQQWYYQQGHPSYQIKWSQTENVVSLSAEQSQSHSSVSFFEMPIPIKFIGPGKDTTLIFDHHYSGESFSALIPFPIQKVQFDPEQWILSSGNSIIENYPIGNQVSLYPNPTKKELNVLSVNNSNPVRYLEITDASGKTMFQSEEYKGLQKIITINTATLAKGTYLVKIVLQKEVVFKSFVKL